MNRWIVFILLTMMPFASAFALVPKPYIGASIQSNSPTGDFAKDDWSNEQGGAKSGIGGEIDLGLNGDRGSVYLGYRFGKHDAEAKAEVPGYGEVKASGEWEINRWVLGARWHLFGSLPSPVVPTLGGGVTYGKSTAGATASAGSFNESDEEDSDSGMGWFIEGGAIVRLMGNLSLLADLQYHTFDADFSDTDLGSSRSVKISFFTLQVGARLALM